MNTPHFIKKISLEHTSDWPFAELSSVAWSSRFNRGGGWYPPNGDNLAKIEMGWEEDGSVMWHEFFHSVYHNSPMNASPNNWWTEAFCNAFGEVNTQQFYRRNYTKEDVELCKDDQHLRTYILPCIVILHHVDFDATKFREFWISINEMARLDSTFDVSNILNYLPSCGFFSSHGPALI